MQPAPSLLDWCHAVVVEGALETKLRPPPPTATTSSASLEERATREVPMRPGRDASIALSDEKKPGKLPKLGALQDPAARVACLSRFAHHELCAVELFAWAVLRFPEMPAGLARALVTTAAEEQLHCRLYLDRLAAHGAVFGALPLSDYFWKHVDKLDTPAAFLCAMGLTLEQANLDFTLMYRDAFRAAGDDATALVIQRVHDDEVRHVALATLWLKRSNADADNGGAAHADVTDLAAYQAHAPFPFSLARAKGRRFDVGARKRAGLSDAMIEAVRAAKPYEPLQQRAVGAGSAAAGDVEEPA